jgi:hypothetical protein
MTNQPDSGNGRTRKATATHAIAAVSKRGSENERKKKQKTIKKWVASIALIVIVISAALGTYLLRTYQPKLADVPVAILLPRIDGESPAWDNAQRQKQGFDKALEDSKKRTGDPYIYFDFAALSYKGNDAKKKEEKQEEIDRVIGRIKDRYENKDGGSRVFIITMSGAVGAVREEFKAWAKTVPSRDRPVLIATVASAPDIAEQKNGVLRHYIQSKDEVAVMSTYIESLKPTPQFVGVFYVDDDYGDKAKDLFVERLKDPFEVDTYKTAINVSKEDLVDSGLKQFMEDVEPFLMVSADKSVVAVIVGYGTMISSTLEALRDKAEFEGLILVVSTLTEKQWRPEFLNHDDQSYDHVFANRIHTIGPTATETDDDRRGVVYQFSYMTLDRTLECTDELKSATEDRAESFWDCWIDKETTLKLEKNWAEVEITADGDSHVTLKMLDSDDWK